MTSLEPSDGQLDLFEVYGKLVQIFPSRLHTVTSAFDHGEAFSAKVTHLNTPPETTCSYPQCKKPKYCRGYCTKHYQRMNSYGSPEATKKVYLSLDRPQEIYRHIVGNVQIDPVTGCWEWQRARRRRGYGFLCIKYKTYPVTRLMCWIVHGMDLGDERYACHHCDNPPCCNPEHLFVGTNSENIQDSFAKGRKRGSSLYNAKLTESDIPVIENLRRDGLSARLIGLRFGVSESVIERVLQNETWKHVPRQAA